jgi:hypothetical protein
MISQRSHGTPNHREPIKSFTKRFAALDGWKAGRE